MKDFHRNQFQNPVERNLRYPIHDIPLIGIGIGIHYQKLANRKNDFPQDSE